MVDDQILVVGPPFFLSGLMECGAIGKGWMGYRLIMYLHRILVQVGTDLVGCLIKVRWKLLVSRKKLSSFCIDYS